MLNKHRVMETGSLPRREEAFEAARALLITPWTGLFMSLRCEADEVLLPSKPSTQMSMQSAAMED